MGKQSSLCLRRVDREERKACHRAAAASWFLRLGELGSVVRALAASSSLLDDMEIVFRLDTTCVWSSLD